MLGSRPTIVINFVIGKLAEPTLIMPERLFTEMKSEESRGKPSD
jgi:hypothetical protein